VGMAYRMIEAVVAPAAPGETAAAGTNPARRRRLTTAGRTGRVSHRVFRVFREKNSDVTQSWSSSLALPSSLQQAHGGRGPYDVVKQWNNDGLIASVLELVLTS